MVTVHLPKGVPLAHPHTHSAIRDLLFSCPTISVGGDPGPVCPAGVGPSHPPQEGRQGRQGPHVPESQAQGL